MMNGFGILLKNLRDDRDLNLTQLGKKAGYDRKSIRQWESGVILPPNDQTINDLCQALATNPTEATALMDAAIEVHFQIVYQKYPTGKKISK